MKRLLLVLIGFAAAVAASGQDYEWKVVPFDGSRTGCTAPSADNVDTTVGYFKGGKYVAPNGKTYGRHTIVAKTADHQFIVRRTPKVFKKSSPIT